MLIISAGEQRQHDFIFDGEIVLYTKLNQHKTTSLILSLLILYPCFCEKSTQTGNKKIIPKIYGKAVPKIDGERAKSEEKTPGEQSIAASQAVSYQRFCRMIRVMIPTASRSISRRVTVKDTSSFLPSTRGKDFEI